MPRSVNLISTRSLRKFVRFYSVSGLCMIVEQDTDAFDTGDQDFASPGYDPDYTLDGGSYLNDCGLFSLVGVPAS